jgi:hypothetical protein
MGWTAFLGWVLHVIWRRIAVMWRRIAVPLPQLRERLRAHRERARIAAVLVLVRKEIPPEIWRAGPGGRTLIQYFLANGAWSLALEQLCDELRDRRAIISLGLYLAIRRAARAMKLPASTWRDLHRGEVLSDGGRS